MLMAARLKNPSDSDHSTVYTKIVVEVLKERETVPGVWRLQFQHCVHVDGEQRPEDLRVLDHQVTVPGKRLKTHRSSSIKQKHCCNPLTTSELAYSLTIAAKEPCPQNSGDGATVHLIPPKNWSINLLYCVRKTELVCILN